MSKLYSGAEIVFKCLEDQGVSNIFGYPGGAVLPIYDELKNFKSIKHILVRHEQGAGHAAEGYARSTGKPGLVLGTSGPGATGRTYIWMPQLFAKMSLGKPLSILFFLGLTFAGFSSLISMLELAVRNLIDFGVKRATAVGWIMGVCFLMGIPSARNLNLLDNQDFVWGVALMLAGVFVALEAIKYGLSRIVEEISLGNEDDWSFPRWWQPVIN